MADHPSTAYYELIDLTSPEGRSKVYSLVLSQDRTELAALRVLEVCLATARSAVIEKLYVDRDYLAAFSRFYSRVYRNVTKWCSRVHFFACELEELDLSNLSDSQADYLGFSVVRPLSTFKTGRTVLKPGIEDGEEYHLAVYEHDVNVAGNLLSVTGASFLEQDTRTAACASAAIWMATAGYATQLGLGRTSTTQITELATAFDVSAGRAMPSEGLTTAQMLQSFRGLGLDPKLYPQPNLEQAISAIYNYVESQIPVIIGVQFESDSDIWHTVTAVGHKYDPTRNPDPVEMTLHDGSTLEFRRSSGWADAFIVNDDQRGPYRTLRFLEPSAYPPNYDPWGEGVRTPDNSAVFEMDCDVTGLPELGPVSPFGGRPARGVVRYVLVPLPPGVSLLAEEAELKAADWIHGFPYVLPKSKADGLRAQLNLSDLVLRTYLRPSNRFKLDVANRSGISSGLSDFYKAMPLPKYVWVTEVSSAQWMSQKRLDRRLMCGEILNDCSGNPYTASFVSIHLPGYIVKTGPESGDPGYALVEDLWEITSDTPYPHLSR